MTKNNQLKISEMNTIKNNWKIILVTALAAYALSNYLDKVPYMTKIKLGNRIG